VANTRKKRREQKVPVSFSIKRKVWTEFKRYCVDNEAVPSHIAEEMMNEFNLKNR